MITIEMEQGTLVGQQVEVTAENKGFSSIVLHWLTEQIGREASALRHSPTGESLFIATYIVKEMARIGLEKSGVPRLIGIIDKLNQGKTAYRVVHKPKLSQFCPLPGEGRVISVVGGKNIRRKERRHTKRK